MSKDVKELIGSLVETGEADREYRIAIAKRNENFYTGNQYWDLSPAQVSYYTFIQPDRQPVVHNHIAPAVDAAASRLVKFTPFPKAVPNTANDLEAARIANIIIKRRAREDFYEVLLDLVARYGYLGGVAGIKTCYNQLEDQVKNEPLSIFDFILDPNSDSNVDNADWVIFVSHLNKERAEQILESQGIDPEKADLTEEEYNQVANPNKKQCAVKVLELWLLPNRRPEYPEGLYAKQIGGELVEQTPFPEGYTYQDRERQIRVPYLPLALFSPRSQRGTAYGDTPLSSAIAPQRHLNRLETDLAHLETLSGSIKLKLPHSVAKRWQATKNQMIVGMTPIEMQYAGYFRPPEINPLMLANRDILIDRIYRLFGLTELEAGNADTKTHVSAKQVAYLNEIARQKAAGAARSFIAMLQRMWRQTLAQMQIYYVLPRLMAHTDESEIAIASWKGSDLNGSDIILEPVDGEERWSSTTAQEQLARRDQGLEDPKEVIETSQTGLEETMIGKYHRMLADEEIKSILKGGQPTMQIPAPVMLKRIDEVAGILDPIQRQMLLQIRDLYSQGTGSQQQVSQPLPV